MGSFTTTLDNRSSETLKTDIKGLPDTTIPPEGQTQQTIMFECKNVFVDPPTIRISYLAGALQALTLQLPVLLHKYMEGAELSSEDFFKADWRCSPRSTEYLWPCQQEQDHELRLCTKGGQRLQVGYCLWRRSQCKERSWCYSVAFKRGQVRMSPSTGTEL